MNKDHVRSLFSTPSVCGIRRREFLRASATGAAAMLFGGAALTPAGCGPVTSPPLGDVSARPEPGSGGVALDVALQATYAEVSILTGPATRVATYQATVLAGDSAGVSALPSSYLGPIIHARKGQRLRVRLNNGLSEPTIIHWHGLHVPADMDGHPRSAIGAGEEYIYEFDVTNRAGTYWFHPHPHGRTGPQVYQGLAGLLLVSDDEEDAVTLPSGDHDIPLVLQDRVFNTENQFVYAAGGMMMGMMGSDGVLGTEILVNGHSSFTLSVATRAYRLRVLNGSNSRVYKLAWSDGTALRVIATDGGLLETPVPRDYVMLAPGERVELWADFSQQPVDSEMSLRSLPFSGGDLGMGGMSSGSLPNGAAFEVMRVRVERQEQEPLTLPERLSTIDRYRVEDAVNTASPRTFTASSGGMMRWLLNDRTFEMEQVAPNEVVQLGTLEIWELANSVGTMEMMHPIHIHGVQFQIVERTVLPSRAAGWETVRQGYVDEGWKDTVLLMPGERVKLMLRFSDYAGLYLYHCHNLEHEDQGMMRNYLVQA